MSLYDDLTNVISWTNWRPGIDRRKLEIEHLGLSEAQISRIARKCADYIETRMGPKKVKIKGIKSLDAPKVVI